MRQWVRSDGTAVMAILAGAAVGAVMPPMPFASSVSRLDAPHAVPSHSSSDDEALPEDVGPVSDPIAFHATSFDEGWGLEGDYAGALSRVGEELRVELAFAVVRAVGPEDAFVDGSEHLTGIRLALAEAGPDGWRIVREGPVHAVDASVPFGSRLALEGASLTLPGVKEEELVGRWLVIVHEMKTTDAEGHESKAWSYAHAEPDLIPRLMVWVEDGC